MTQYLYPQNLKATANLWLWSLKDFAILSIAALLSVLIVSVSRFILPLALTLGYGFLTIRADDTTVLDYDPFIDLLGCCFYGVGLYLFPYFITSKFFLCDEILEDSKKYFLLKNNY